MMEARYYRALPLYEQLLADEPTNANYNYKIGLCYLNSAEKLKSTSFLEQAILNASKGYMEMQYGEVKAPVSAYLFLARAYHLDYKFDEAIQAAEKYKSFTKRRDDIEEANKLIQECKNARELYNNPNQVKIRNLGEQVNSRYRDFAPVLTLDGEQLIFTSNREGNIGEINEEDGLPFSDIYCANVEEQGWAKAFAIDSSINSGSHEAAIAVSGDGTKILIYKEDNNGDIYITELMGKSWSIPVPIGKGINSDAHEPSACFSVDGKKLFFVSDRKGGFGGKDIYVASLGEDGTWGNIQNAGPMINTKYDEDAPFMHPDGKDLFFCSNGHNTMGGYDIFYSIFNNESKVWSPAINVGYPINTPDDEAFYVMSADGKKGYFASAKPEGYGDLDIYEIENETILTQEVALIKGVMNNHSNVDLSNNAIVVINARTGEIVSIQKSNPTTGKYTLAVLPSDDYYLSYMVDGKEVFKELVKLKRGERFQTVVKNIEIDADGKGTLAEVSKTEEKKSEPVAEKTETKTNESKETRETKTPEITTGLETSFKKFFRYNQNVVGETDKNYNSFIKEAANSLKQGKSIHIEASASKVPTTTFKDNGKLASVRAEKMKAKLIADLKAKGIKVNPESITINTLVEGPEYNNDFIEKKKTYEQYQYVRVIIK